MRSSVCLTIGVCGVVACINATTSLEALLFAVVGGVALHLYAYSVNRYIEEARNNNKTSH